MIMRTAILPTISRGNHSGNLPEISADVLIEDSCGALMGGSDGANGKDGVDTEGGCTVMAIPPEAALVGAAAGAVESAKGVFGPGRAS